MKLSHGIIPVLATLAVLAGGIGPAMAGESAPCVELRLKGGYELAIPCPEGLDEVLESLRFEPAPRRDIVIDPKWPHDQAMSADHDWPWDSAMIAPQTDKAENAPPLLDDLLNDLLSLFEQDFNRLPSLLEQDSLDPWETQLPNARYFYEKE